MSTISASVISDLFIPIVGLWLIQDDVAEYKAPTDTIHPYGLVIGPSAFNRGSYSVKVAIAKAQPPDNDDYAARLVIGYDAGSGSYYSIGIGGYNFAYVIDRFTPGIGWRLVRGIGTKDNLTKEIYNLKVVLSGQSVSLFVYDTHALQGMLPEPIAGHQIGLF